MKIIGFKASDNYKKGLRRLFPGRSYKKSFDTLIDDYITINIYILEKEIDKLTIDISNLDKDDFIKNGIYKRKLEELKKGLTNFEEVSKMIFI